MTFMRADAFIDIVITCNGAPVAVGTSDSHPITGDGTLSLTIQKATGPGGTVPLSAENCALRLQATIMSETLPR